MMEHSQRQLEMKQIGTLFNNIGEQLDNFRYGVVRKLNELHMAL